MNLPGERANPRPVRMNYPGDGKAAILVTVAPFIVFSSSS